MMLKNQSDSPISCSV